MDRKPWIAQEIAQELAGAALRPGTRRAGGAGDAVIML